MPGYGLGGYGLGLYGIGEVYEPFDSTPPPSRTLSGDAWSRAADQGGPRLITRLTVTVPGRDPVELSLLSFRDGGQCDVSKKLDSSARTTVSVTILRVPGQSTFDMVTDPGAIFELIHGFHFGANAYDLRPVGRLVLAAQPKGSRKDPIQLSLVDYWKRIEECRLSTPFSVSAGDDRIAKIRSLVTGAISNAEFVVTATPNLIGSAATWPRERHTAVNDLLSGGSMIGYFDPLGRFVIADDPQIDPARPVTTFTDGPRASIVDLENQSLFVRDYNAVTLVPTEGQIWTQRTIHIADTSHPRHRNRVLSDGSTFGVRPYFYSNPSLGFWQWLVSTGGLPAPGDFSLFLSRIGQTILQRVIAASERIEVSTWAQSLLDPGQTIATMQAATWTDPARPGTWLVEQVDHHCLSGETKIVGRSAATIVTEETS